MTFAENLRDILDYKGIELKELSVGTGISKNTLDNYLSGQKSLPNIENGLKIARFLGISVEELVEGKNHSQEKRINRNDLISNLEKLNKHDYYAIADIVNSLVKK